MAKRKTVYIIDNNATGRSDTAFRSKQAMSIAKKRAAKERGQVAVWKTTEDAAGIRSSNWERVWTGDWVG